MNNWPKQSECDAFYGNPRGAAGKSNPAWESTNLIRVPCPWDLRMGDSSIKAITIHKKCADSLSYVLDSVWSDIGQSQEEADRLGYSTFSGSFAFRKIRAGSRLSMHAYGCAIDFDAPHNALGSVKHRFSANDPLIRRFKEECWVWGGDWKTRPDAMHIQAAIV